MAVMPRSLAGRVGLVAGLASAACSRAQQPTAAPGTPAALASERAPGGEAARTLRTASTGPGAAPSGVGAGGPAPDQPDPASPAGGASAGAPSPGRLETHTLRYCAVDEVDPHDPESPGLRRTVMLVEATVELVADVGGVAVYEAAWTLPEGVPVSPATRWATAGGSLWVLDALEPALSPPDASDPGWRARLRATAPTLRLTAGAAACSVVRGRSPYGATRRTACFDAVGPTRWEEANLAGPRVVALRRLAPGEACAAMD